jgi:hypothetical protein
MYYLLFILNISQDKIIYQRYYDFFVIIPLIPIKGILFYITMK